MIKCRPIPFSFFVQLQLLEWDMVIWTMELCISSWNDEEHQSKLLISIPFLPVGHH